MMNTEKADDRREKFRFPIQRELRYRLLENDRIVACGTGQTINIGSGGVAFLVDHQLKRGAFIELSISWPALLDETCPMRLTIFGRVLRSGGRRSACSVEKYEFRTQARVMPAETAVRHDSMLKRWADGYRKEVAKTAVMTECRRAAGQ